MKGRDEVSENPLVCRYLCYCIVLTSVFAFASIYMHDK